MINLILVDLDDVCNRFTMSVLHHLGCSIYEKDYPIEIGYDIVAAYNRMRPSNVTAAKFWSMVTPSIWDFIPKRNVTDWLLNHCAKHVGRRNVMICTKSIGHPLHFAGKIQWMRDNLPHWIQDQYSITPVKHAYAHPSVLLIDDSPKNVNDFVRCEGEAILMPRPWNKNNRLDPQQHIIESFMRLF